MAIPEQLITRVGIMAFDIVSDVVMDYVASKRKEGVETITVTELELFALEAKKLKDTEISKIKGRLTE
jgi:hypothetical protein